MTCICGHSDDLHTVHIFPNMEENRGCVVCLCTEFCEDIDEDELEVE